MNARETVQFLAELSVNNEKLWFDAQRPRYALLRAEFVRFVAHALERLRRVDPTLEGVRAEQCLFRINRDTRFSHNKSPYKTQFSAALSREGRGSSSPVYYLHLDYQGELFVAGGIYAPDNAVLERVRRFMVEHPKSLEQTLQHPDLERFLAPNGGTLEGERLKKLPKGFAQGSPHPELLRLKQFVVSKSFNLFDGPDFDGPDLNGPEVSPLEFVGQNFTAMFPLLEWLRKASS